MKKILLGSILIFFMFICVACMDIPEDTILRLNAPLDIKIDKNVLSFSKVDGASSYILNINGENITLYDNTYIFTEDGDYRIYIQSISGEEGVGNSTFSRSLDFKVRFLEYPSDVRITNNQVTFTKDADAQSYDVEIDGIVYNSKEDLPPYLEPGTYDIRIKARSDIYNESEFSPIIPITVDPLDRIYSKHQYQYSVYSIFELPLYKYTKMDLLHFEMSRTEVEDDEAIEVEQLKNMVHFSVTQNTVFLTKSYLVALVDTLEASGDKKLNESFILKTNLGDHLIDLEINYLDTPYSYSGQKQLSNSKDDVIFMFETFDYKFIEVKGLGITKEDYHFEDDVLTIFADYVNKAYGAKRKTEPIEFIVVFMKKDVLYEYAVFIEK